METYTFHCKFITPAFLGGANPKGTPELRPSAIKGALRFWWRAQCQISDINTLNERETAIFGGLTDEKATKSSFSLRVRHKDFMTGENLWDNKATVRNKTFKVNIFAYLAFGIYEQQERKLNREFVAPGETFDLVFQFFSSDYKDEVLAALRLLALFGGIGTKTRNGYGKFEITENPDPTNWQSRLKILKKGPLLSYSSFSQDFKVFQTKTTHATPELALAETGKAYKNAREWIENQHIFEHRSYIGSPIVEKKRQQSFLDRHSKPYYLTVLPENGRYRGAILFLPYLFLEDGEGMMKELYDQKKEALGNSALNIHDLKEILLDTPISKHQEYYTKSNGIFNKELCHSDNPHALIQLPL